MLKRWIMRAGCGANLSAAGLLGFFVTANVKVRDNGSGKIALVYPAATITTPEMEERRYVSASTRPTSVRIENGLARVRVAFEDINRLHEAPEFVNTALELRADEGRFRGVVRATNLGGVRSDRKATIHITLPGPVIDSNGQEQAGNRVGWTAPIARYFTEEGIPLEATYQTRTLPSGSGNSADAALEAGAQGEQGELP